MIQHDTKEIDYSALRGLLQAADTSDALRHAIVDSPFMNRLLAVHLGLGIVVLLECDHEAGTLNRVAISKSEMAKAAMQVSSVPFHEIKIPLDYTKNILIKALDTRKHQTTDDWKHMFSPVLSAEEARINQAAAGIGTSVVHPLFVESSSRPYGAMIFSYYEPPQFIKKPHAEFMTTYVQLVADRLASPR